MSKVEEVVMGLVEQSKTVASGGRDERTMMGSRREVMWIEAGPDKPKASKGCSLAFHRSSKDNRRTPPREKRAFDGRPDRQTSIDKAIVKSEPRAHHSAELLEKAPRLLNSWKRDNCVRGSARWRAIRFSYPSSAWLVGPIN